MLTQIISRPSFHFETECSYGSAKKIKIHVTCHWRQRTLLRKRARKGVLRGPQLPSRVTPRPRKHASSLALDRVPTLPTHEVRALERNPVPAVVSLAVAREPGRVRACYFPLIFSSRRPQFARVRRTPVSDAASPPSTFVAPATSRIPLGIDVGGPPLAWSESRFAGRSGFDVSRVSRDADLVGWLVPLALFPSVGPPARALGLGIATRARRSRTTIVSSPLARLAFSARARSLGSTSAIRLVVLPTSDPGRSSRWKKYPRGPWPLARISVSIFAR